MLEETARDLADAYHIFALAVDALEQDAKKTRIVLQNLETVDPDRRADFIRRAGQQMTEDRDLCFSYLDELREAAKVVKRDFEPIQAAINAAAIDRLHTITNESLALLDSVKRDNKEVRN